MEDTPRIVIRGHGGSAAVCRELEGVPSFVSTLIEILPSPNEVARAAAAELADAVVGALRAAAPGLMERSVPCPDASADGRYDLQVLSEWHRLLVLVADAGASELAASSSPILDHWLSEQTGSPILPLLQMGLDAERYLRGTDLKEVNASRWTATPAENVDEVLALVDLGAEERRVFVSYRRPETLYIAEQLFEELEKHRFDVFVDRFRVPPGRNFQVRLTDELVHKSMVLVLESPTILKSEWVAHELGFAKDHELGRLAVHLPGAVRVPWLDDDSRVFVTPDEVVPRIPTSHPNPIVTDRHELGPQALARVVSRLVAEHTSALLRRKATMLDNLRGALWRHANVSQRLDAAGHLHVTATQPAVSGGDSETWVHGAGRREYVVWITPRPPEIASFRAAHGVCHPGPNPTGAIVTSATFQDTTRREGFAWLADRSLVRLYEDTEVRDLARRIARGENLA